MSDILLFPIGCYWQRTEDSSPFVEVKYTVLWVFPSGRFRYIFCYPGYTWMTASGAWRSAKGVIHCRGTSSSFSDDFTDNHSHRSYTAIYRQTDDGHSLAPVGRSTGLLTRLDVNEPVKKTLLLEEQLVPTHWTDFQSLMRQIEKHMASSRQVCQRFYQRDPPNELGCEDTRGGMGCEAMVKCVPTGRSRRLSVRWHPVLGWEIQMADQSTHSPDHSKPNSPFGKKSSTI